MIKRLVVAILTLSIILGCNTIGFAAEPMLKIRIYAPLYMLNYLDSILSYGVAFTDDTGKQKVITISGENNGDGTLGKYENNREFLIPANQITNKTIDYVYVNVSLKMSSGKLEKRTYYYNSDGTSSLFKEGVVWSSNKDLYLLVYLNSPYVITIKNDINVNDYYIKPSGIGGKSSTQDKVEGLNYDIERGERKYFDKNDTNVTSVCKDGHVYVPITSLAEMFKFNVDYSSQDEYTKIDVTSSDGKTKIALKTGSSFYDKNGNSECFKDQMMPFRSDGIIYVPVRLLEGFGIFIEYSSANRMIYINPRTY